jgi:protein gp37
MTMNSFNNEIMDLLDGDTPRKKYQSLIELRNRNVRMSQALQIWATADLRNTKMGTSILNEEEIAKIQELSK